MDARCGGDRCKVLDRQSNEDAIKCSIPQTAVEDVDGNECMFCKFHLGQGKIFFGENSRTNVGIGLDVIPGNPELSLPQKVQSRGAESL